MEIHDALNDDLVNEPRRLLGEYQFHLGTLTPLITIKLYQMIGREGMYFEQSHFIHTPMQGGPYMTSRPWNDSEEAALRQAVTGLTMHYTEAVQNGHAPSDSWLVPNEDFS